MNKTELVEAIAKKSGLSKKTSEAALNAFTETVGKALKKGDVVDMEGFLYWYEGVNPHITAVTVK